MSKQVLNRDPFMTQVDRLPPLRPSALGHFVTFFAVCALVCSCAVGCQEPGSATRPQQTHASSPPRKSEADVPIKDTDGTTTFNESPPVRIETFEELQVLGAGVRKDAGLTEARTRGDLHEIPGFALLSGEIPDARVKSPDTLDCGWHVFQLLHSWPAEVVEQIERPAHVNVIAKVYWRDPYVVGPREDPLPPIATRRVNLRLRPGDKAAGAYYLKIRRILEAGS